MFEMLIHGARTRIQNRVRREMDAAMPGPPMYFVRGGLPGSGK